MRALKGVALLSWWWHARAFAFSHQAIDASRGHRKRLAPLCQAAHTNRDWVSLSLGEVTPFASARHADVDWSASPPDTMAPWMLVTFVFIHVLSNSLTAQAVPTAMLTVMKNDRVRTAYALGRVSACGALIDILVAPQLGRLSDSIGRKPLLVLLPCISLCLRSIATLRPTVAVLAGVRILSSTLSSGYMVSLKASLADQHQWDMEVLTGRLGLISAASGAAQAVGLLLGGHLVSRSLQLPYLTSAILLGCLVRDTATQKAHPQPIPAFTRHSWAAHACRCLCCCLGSKSPYSRMNAHHSTGKRLGSLFWVCSRQRQEAGSREQQAGNRRS